MDQGPVEKAFLKFQEERNKNFEQFSESIKIQRTNDLLMLFPRIILLHHKKREKWLKVYVNFLNTSNFLERKQSKFTFLFFKR